MAPYASQFPSAWFSQTTSPPANGPLTTITTAAEVGPSKPDPPSDHRDLRTPLSSSKYSKTYHSSWHLPSISPQSSTSNAPRSSIGKRSPVEHSTANTHQHKFNSNAPNVTLTSYKPPPHQPPPMTTNHSLIPSDPLFWLERRKESTWSATGYHRPDTDDYKRELLAQLQRDSMPNTPNPRPAKYWSGYTEGMFQREDIHDGKNEEQETMRSLNQEHTSNGSGSGSGYGDVQYVHQGTRDTYSSKVSSESGSVPGPVKLIDRYSNARP